MLLSQDEEQCEEFDKEFFGESGEIEIRCFIFKTLQGQNIISIKVKDITYQSENIFEALVTYYKLHNALNIKFPPKTAATWDFIQRFLFNFKGDETNSQVETLINELNLFTR